MFLCAYVFGCFTEIEYSNWEGGEGSFVSCCELRVAGSGLLVNFKNFGFKTYYLQLKTHHLLREPLIIMRHTDNLSFRLYVKFIVDIGDMFANSENTNV